MKTYGNKKSSGDWKPGSKGGYKKPSYGTKSSFGGSRAGSPRSGNQFGGRPSFGDREERPVLHSATCSKCNVPCEVPFKPNGKKPIFCRECFRKEEGHATAPSYGSPSYDRPSFEKPAYRSTPRVGSDEVAKQLNELNKKMDRILEALTDLGEEDGDEDEEGGDENAT